MSQPRTLLVRGFNTYFPHEVSIDIYYIFKIMFPKMDHFYYSKNESYESVYARFADVIHTRYDLIVCHSMGCFLVLNAILRGDISRDQPMVFINPFIFNSLRSYMAKIFPASLYYAATWMYLPRFIVIPTPFLIRTTNYVQDIFDKESYTPIPMHQPLHVYRNMLSDTDTVHVLNTCTNTKVLYGYDDKLTPIAETTLAKIKDLCVFDARHESFRDATRCREFMDIFLYAVNELEVRMNRQLLVFRDMSPTIRAD